LVPYREAFEWIILWRFLSLKKLPGDVHPSSIPPPVKTGSTKTEDAEIEEGRKFAGR
jgi:hypothetical protein